MGPGPGLLQRLGRPTPLGVRARAVDAALGGVDPEVVDARLPAAHVALVVELPQLDAVRAPPLAIDVAALVLEPRGDPVALEGPQVLAERVLQLAGPLLLQERGDLGAAGEEPVAVAPDRV